MVLSYRNNNEGTYDQKMPIGSCFHFGKEGKDKLWERKWERDDLISSLSRQLIANLEGILEHRWQTQRPRAESGPPPCFYLVAPSSLPLVNE